MAGRIKAIIFDSGGVLVDDPASELIAYCAEALGVADAEFREVQQRFEPDFQKGIILEDRFWEMVCAELKVKRPNSPSLWYEALKTVFSRKEEMFSLAVFLRSKGYKIAVLSNTEVPAMRYLYEQGYELFEIRIFSCVEGTRKPERRIYEITLGRLGLQAKEVIFIDDNENCIKGAKKVGMNTVLFRNPEQLKKELEGSFRIFLR